MDVARKMNPVQEDSADSRTEMDIRVLYRDALVGLDLTKFEGNKRLLRLQEWIQKNGTSQLSLTKAARISCLEPHYFSQVFHAHLGLTFRAWRVRYRVSMVLVEMCHGERNLHDIMRMCGYQERRSLERSVKRKTGMTPAKLRKWISRDSFAPLKASIP